MTTDEIAIVMSGISILISIALVIYEVYKSTKINKVNLRSEHFKSLYNDYMLTKIPLARNKMEFNNDGKLVCYEDLLITLWYVVSSSLYYKYVDNDYYLELKTHVTEVEEYISTLAGQELSEENIKIAYAEIENKIGDIYQCMQYKYLNG